MIIALTQNWHDLLLRLDEEELNLSSHATVRCVITDCELEADLITRRHLWKSPSSRGENQAHTVPPKRPPLQMLQRQACMFLHFPLVRSMRNCNLFFLRLWVGQAQSGFNHKTPWPRARMEWGKLLVYLWRPYKHKHRQAETSRLAARETSQTKVHVL